MKDKGAGKELGRRRMEKWGLWPFLYMSYHDLELVHGQPKPRGYSSNGSALLILSLLAVQNDKVAQPKCIYANSSLRGSPFIFIKF